jgi:hypothetical protein
VSFPWHFLSFLGEPPTIRKLKFLPSSFRIQGHPYPHTVRVVVNQMPVPNIGTIQLDLRTGLQGPRGIGGIPRRGGWVQAGY